MVFLKVSPWKVVILFRKRVKMGPRYIGPFWMIARVGKGAYILDFPEELSLIHNTLHVSQLRKCVADDSVGGVFGQGSVAASEGFWMDVGTQVRNARALPRVIHSNGLRGWSLLQVGENCKMAPSGIFVNFGWSSRTLGIHIIHWVYVPEPQTLIFGVQILFKHP